MLVRPRIGSDLGLDPRCCEALRKSLGTLSRCGASAMQAGFCEPKAGQRPMAALKIYAAKASSRILVHFPCSVETEFNSGRGMGTPYRKAMCGRRKL